MVEALFAPVGEPCPNDPNAIFVWLCVYNHDDSPINRPDRNKPILSVRMGHIEDFQIVVARLEQLTRLHKRQAMPSSVASILDIIPLEFH